MWPMRLVGERDLFGTRILRTGYGDVSDPVYIWKVPADWTIEMCREVFTEFGQPGVTHERGLHPGAYYEYGFQDFIDHYDKV